MGRQSRQVEFLQTLMDLTDLSQTAFARACGKKVQNMNKYLSGELKPGGKVLISCVRHLYEWDVKVLRELLPIPENLNEHPESSGLYVLYDSAGNILYIGKATNFRAEVKQTLGRRLPVALRFGPTLKKQQPKFRHVAYRLSLYGIESPRLRHNVESLFLRAVANQTHNSNIGKPR